MEDASLDMVPASLRFTWSLLGFWRTTPVFLAVSAGVVSGAIGGVRSDMQLSVQPATPASADASLDPNAVTTIDLVQSGADLGISWAVHGAIGLLAAWRAAAAAAASNGEDGGGGGGLGGETALRTLRAPVKPKLVVEGAASRAVVVAHGKVSGEDQAGPTAVPSGVPSPGTLGEGGDQDEKSGNADDEDDELARFVDSGDTAGLVRRLAEALPDGEEVVLSA